jgi:hypothetical protein
MQNLNEHINRMRRLIGAKHGIIKPLISEQDLTPAEELIRKETEQNLKFYEKNKTEWLKIVDWLVENFQCFKQVTKDPQNRQVVAYKKAGGKNNKGYWFILKDDKIFIVNDDKNTADTNTIDPNKISGSGFSGPTLGEFLIKFQAWFENSPYLQNEYPDLLKKLSYKGARIPNQKDGPNGDPYTYKKEGENYFYAKKGTKNWIQQTNKDGIEAIKTKIFNTIKEFYEPIDDLENEDEDKDFISDFDDDVDLVVGI